MIRLSGGELTLATGVPSAGAAPRVGVADLHAARGEQARQLARGVHRGIVHHDLARCPRLKAVIDGERTERTDVAVDVIRVLPRRHVPDVVVPRVVGDDATGDALHTGVDDVVGERVEAGGDVALRVRLRLEIVVVLVGGEHRIPTADQEQLVDRSVVGRGGRYDLRLVGEVGPKSGEHRRRDEHLLGRRADERRVGVVACQLRAAAVDQEAGAVA